MVLIGGYNYPNTGYEESQRPDGEPDVDQLRAEHAAFAHDVYEPGCPACAWAKLNYVAPPERDSFDGDYDDNARDDLTGPDIDERVELLRQEVQDDPDDLPF